VTGKEPERELIRRALPFALPALVIAFVAGTIVADVSAGWSAALGAAIVFANFTLHGLSLSRAARISLTALYAVGLGGFVVRLGAILALLFALNRLAWFSPVAFAAAVIPGTIALLAFEMKQLSGPMQVELWTLHREGA
jgi:ATP synthase protein I